jgi:hypothetical protein
VTAAAEVEYRAWYQPYKDARGGLCAYWRCTFGAVGRTVYTDDTGRSVTRRQCADHLPAQAGGVL